MLRTTVLFGILFLATYNVIRVEPSPPESSVPPSPRTPTPEQPHTHPENLGEKRKAAPLASDGKPLIKLPESCSYYKTLLSLDGGGMKGIITTQVLKKLTNSIKEYLLNNQDVLALEETRERLVTKEDFHIDLADYFDAIAGISAGSWVATYIASRGRASADVLQLEHIKRRFGEIRPGSAEALDVFFMEYGIYIYPPRLQPITIRPAQLGTFVPQIALLTCPQYRANGLEWVLDKFLGDTKLSEVSTSLLIVSVDLNIRSTIQFSYDTLKPTASRHALGDLQRRRVNLGKCIDDLIELKDDPKLDQTIKDRRKERIQKRCDKYRKPEKNRKPPTVRTGNVWTRTIPRNFSADEDFEEPGIKFSSDMDYYIKDIARASSAFPTVHPAKNIKPFFDVVHEYDLIDGAMVSNNPTLQAIIWVASNPEINVTEIATLSIGTGTSLSSLESVGTGGFVQWVAPVGMLLLDSSPEFVQSNLDYMFYGTMRTLVLPGQYLRIQTVAGSDTPEGRILSTGTDATVLPELKRIGEDMALKFEANIDAFVEKFIFARCSNHRYALVERVRKSIQEKIYYDVEKSYNDTLKMFGPQTRMDEKISAF